MKDRFRDFPLTVEEVRKMMKREDAKRATWFAVGVGVITILVALVIWVAKRREKDLEEHYEYFDEDFDELDEDFDDFDESIYDDEDEEKIEYVQINDFMNNDAEEKAEETVEDTTEKTEESAEESVEEKTEEIK
ncbi:MAG: hypothetical protein J6F30_03255 [Cellulosilyticum sp.]|nr:hypothetical protein [Cellulosilyticum sp.]